MTADNATPQDGENVSDSGSEKEPVSMLRGESSYFGEAVVDVEESVIGSASLVIRDDQNLNYIRVDLLEADARELVDELQDAIEEIEAE